MNKLNQEPFKPEPETLLDATELDDLAEVTAEDIDASIEAWKADPPDSEFTDLLEAETDA